ncbi:MAG: fructose PTS transporter subunit IIA [Planctomycetes bacterium]|nr:fructose PTS transporter subunit IIA [Planctomycetota bacterium]MDA8377426.1 fructose PTS transporter subunit IIA [Planctomycetia bacterium]
MNLTDILKRANIKVPLAAGEKNEAIKELVELLAANKEVSSPDLVLASVLERESIRTTGVGHGLAIPHSKCGGVKELTIAIGKPEQPIDFQSLDGQPVYLIVLLVSPPDQTGAHIQSLARISRLMTIDTFRSKLKAAKTPNDIFDTILAQEKTMAPEN